VTDQSSPEAITLTTRQQEVAALAAQGFSYAQIADKLSISPRTAEQHIRDIASRLPDSEIASPLRRVMRYMLSQGRAA
jgi:DNA-binding NarL/FixJ family response regulator